jgi:Brp/Blh family beta-carotene 15,15'-monooxygenase
MSKIQSLFVGLVLVLNLGFLTFGGVSIEVQVIFSTVLISLFGIPHGAIDHIIYREERTTSALVFYSFYFGLMIIYLCFWMYSPVLSMVVFLVLSAFHFGQSQFSHLSISNKWKRIILYQMWGLSILSGLVVFNYDQLYTLSANNADVLAILPAFQYQYTLYVLIISSVVTLVILTSLKATKHLSMYSFIKEVLLFGFIHVCFFTLPLLIGFTLYFSTLHSMQVLVEEFGYLKTRMRKLSVKGFILLVTPYTLISILGLGLLLLLSYFQIIAISGTLLVFIVISILTLPHSIVMDNFYFKSIK